MITGFLGIFLIFEEKYATCHEYVVTKKAVIRMNGTILMMRLDVFASRVIKIESKDKEIR